jgi:mono/diheme cytochrome c family protein
MLLTLCAALAPAAVSADEPNDAGRLAAGQNGKTLFNERCAVCHAPGGMGALVLTRRLGPGKAILAQRTDLTAGYVQYVARNGLGSMPRLSRVEVTNPELTAIAAWLASAKS